MNIKLIITLIIIGIIAVAIPVTYRLAQTQQIFRPKAQETAANITWPDGSIAKVGAEFLYQVDLDLELSFYPPSEDINTAKQVIYDKMVTDSVILQGASGERLITLDDKIFNSPIKTQADYIKRVQTVKTAKTALETRGEIQGAYVSIWFNNNRPASETEGDETKLQQIEDKKKQALDKITPLHDKVAAGEMTIIQAGEAIRNDPTLESLDPAYKVNAISDFSVSPSEAITIDPDFDAILKGLAVNGVTEVTLLQAHQIDTNKVIDASYVFGTVTNKSTSTSYETWLGQKRSAYAAIKRP